MKRKIRLPQKANAFDYSAKILVWKANQTKLEYKIDFEREMLMGEFCVCVKMMSMYILSKSINL